MSIAPKAGKKVICFVVEEVAEVKENIFPKSLLGATIQDSSMRERRNK